MSEARQNQGLVWLHMTPDELARLSEDDRALVVPLPSLPSKQHDELLAELLKNREVRRVAEQCVATNCPLLPLAHVVEPLVKRTVPDLNIYQLGHLVVAIYSAMRAQIVN